MRLIGLSLVLVGIVGLQFSCLFYVDTLYRERKAYLQSLEQKYTRLTERLAEAECRVAEQDELLETLRPELAGSEDAWAEVIDER